uniref:regulator of G-protein signaling 10 isoform X3 n=1 Tax=Myodes glareolus TaxID=447135 RepID=UPI00202001AB|nr:regulator of G-protein signaling 10 isoform X3 [Myodes glareolus]
MLHRTSTSPGAARPRGAKKWSPKVVAPQGGGGTCVTRRRKSHFVFSPWINPTHSLGQVGKTKNPQRRNDIHDGDGSSSSSHQGLKSTAKWATSLENLLEDPEGVKRFRMQEKAKEIYMTFLSNKASSQVNVEGQSRLSEKILEEPHPLMFQKLQDQIFNLMKYDSYSRFLKSDLFLKHKRTEEEEEDPSDAQTAAKRASRIYNT